MGRNQGQSNDRSNRSHDQSFSNDRSQNGRQSNDRGDSRQGNHFNPGEHRNFDPSSEMRSHQGSPYGGPRSGAQGYMGSEPMSDHARSFGSRPERFSGHENQQIGGDPYGTGQQLGSNQYGSSQYGSSQYGMNQHGSDQQRGSSYGMGQHSGSGSYGPEHSSDRHGSDQHRSDQQMGTNHQYGPNRGANQLGGDYSSNQFGRGQQYGFGEHDGDGQRYGSMGGGQQQYGNPQYSNAQQYGGQQYGARSSMTHGAESNAGRQGGFSDDIRSMGASYGSSSSGNPQGYDGRDSGAHSGRGPKGFQRSDERIKERVSEVLEEHAHIDASEIEVVVTQGEVTLSGTVHDRNEKRLAEDIIDNLPGVKEVNNQLRVLKARASDSKSGGMSTTSKTDDKTKSSSSMPSSSSSMPSSSTSMSSSGQSSAPSSTPGMGGDASTKH